MNFNKCVWNEYQQVALRTRGKKLADYKIGVLVY